MRIWSAALIALALAGCDKPDVKACETFIKSGLKAPSTYRRVSVTERLQSFPNWTAFRSETGSERKTLLEMMGQKEPSHPTIRIVAIEYDAANAFGVALRSGEVCAFEEGQNEQTRDMVLSSAQRRRDYAAKPPAGLKYPCCL